MIDTIIKEVKDELTAKLFASGLEKSITPMALDMAREVVSSKISEQVAGGNIHGLLGLFGNSAPLDQSALVKNMISDYETKLTSKTATTPAVAHSVSTFIVPYLMNRISHTVNRVDEQQALSLLGQSKTPLKQLKSMGSNVFRVLFL
jgi:hypothetical protein